MGRLINSPIRRGSIESELLQMEFGQKLMLEKQVCRAAGHVWKEYVKENHNLSRERADELIRIGLGVISVADYRESRKLKRRVDRSKSKKNIVLKGIFSSYADKSIAISAKAEKTVGRYALSPADVEILRRAVGEAIAAWQALFDVLK